jgi:ribosome maturation factor RimP
MPMPTEDRVSRLVAALVEGRGYDLEGVRVTAAGAKSTVQVMVDGDAGVGLDAIAELSSAVSEVLDEAGDFGETPYTLEVTTPGVDRPLTSERHWRRARGRRVRMLVDGVELTGRVGEVREGEVALVQRGKAGPAVRAVPLTQVSMAVVQVEFNPPDPRELELAGGVQQGRPRPGAEVPDDTAVAEDTAVDDTAVDDTAVEDDMADLSVEKAGEHGE